MGKLTDAYKRNRIATEYSTRIDFSIEVKDLAGFRDYIINKLDTYDERGEVSVGMMGSMSYGSLHISGPVRKDVIAVARDFIRAIHSCGGAC